MIKNKLKMELYRAWDIIKINDELYSATYAFSSMLEQFKTKSITGKTLEDVKLKIDKHIKRWNW